MEISCGEVECLDVPNRTSCMTTSSTKQCQVTKPAMSIAEMSPEVTQTEIDLSNVKTRWRTVAVAISIESSSPIHSVSQYHRQCRGSPRFQNNYWKNFISSLGSNYNRKRDFKYDKEPGEIGKTYTIVCNSSAWRGRLHCQCLLLQCPDTAYFSVWHLYGWSSALCHGRRSTLVRDLELANTHHFL